MLISGITIILVILGATVSPWFLAIAIVLGAFLLQSMIRQLAEMQVTHLQQIWDKTYIAPEPLSEEDDPAVDPALDDMETPLPATPSFTKFLRTFKPKV